MEYFATGVIRTSFGLKGYLKVLLFSDSCDHLKGIKQVVLKKNSKSEMMQVEDIIFRKRETLIKFRGIDNPEDGKKYSGWEIDIPRDLYPELEDGEFYSADIIGCTAIVNGVEAGSIISIVNGAQAPLLEIETENGKRLLPFMKEYIGTVSIPEKRVELLADWILE